LGIHSGHCFARWLDGVALASAERRQGHGWHPDGTKGSSSEPAL
jgi:hypothetical protein